MVARLGVAEIVLAAAPEHHVFGVIEELRAWQITPDKASELFLSTVPPRVLGGGTVVMVDGPHAIVAVDHEVMGDGVMLLQDAAAAGAAKVTM